MPVALVSVEQFYQAALAVPLEPVASSALARAGIELWVRRDDLLDAQLSGNKFYKLFFNLHQAQAEGFDQLLSFGGAYSNHLHALAAAAQRYGMGAIGVVRGERPARLSPTLADAESWGMRLVFISRADYDRKTSAELQTELLARFGPAYVIPEGGANLLGAKGMQVLGRALEQQTGGDYGAVCLPVGTGTSLAGLAAGIDPSKTAIGFSVLKGAGDLGLNLAASYSQLRAQPEPNFAAATELLSATVNTTTNTTAAYAANWRLISGFHAGGYAKKHGPQLREFAQDFSRETGIPLDPVYTIKMFWGISCLAQQGYWPRGSRVIAIHTGGLQGLRGFNRSC